MIICKSCGRYFSFEQKPLNRGYCLICSTVILGIGSSETPEQFKIFYDEYPEFQKYIPLVLKSLNPASKAVDRFLKVLLEVVS